MNLRRLSATGLIALMAVAACGDGTTGSSGDDLSAAEAQAVGTQVLTVAFTALGTAFASLNETADLPDGLSLNVARVTNVPIDETVSQSVNCPAGGTAQVSGSVSGNVNDDDSGNLSVNIEEDLNDCGVTADGKTIVVSTTSPFQLEGTLNFAAGGEPTGTNEITMKGNFTWESDGESGSCGIDLSASFTGTSGSGSGSVCGQDISG